MELLIGFNVAGAVNGFIVPALKKIVYHIIKMRTIFANIFLEKPF